MERRANPASGRTGSKLHDSTSYDEPRDYLQDLAELADSAQIRSVRAFAWRDLDDPDAGGSEVFMEHVFQRWARAGIDVSIRTSAAPGRPEEVCRGDVRALRRGGRMAVFAEAGLAERFGRHGAKPDAVVEVWNGMPFMSPVWWRGPRLTFLHHVHRDMWRLMLPGPLAVVGDTVERKLAPPLYRRRRVMTLSESSRQELIHELGWKESLVRVASPGIPPQFVPGPPGSRSKAPLIVGVGRLAPAKRWPLLVEAALGVKQRVPDLTVALIGDGEQRGLLEEMIKAHGAEDWFRLVGRVDDTELVEWYQRAWIVSSMSLAEGWGMTITEAAGCGTPAIVSRITGHADAVWEGRSGVLVDGVDDYVERASSVLDSAAELESLRAGALARAAALSWSAVAHAAMESLAADAIKCGERRKPK